MTQVTTTGADDNDDRAKPLSAMTERARKRTSGSLDGERSTSPAIFEEKYAHNPDPWSTLTSDYEREKYAASIGALGGRHFDEAIEIGCGIGSLTELMAPQCRRLRAYDGSPTAIERARQRLSGLSGVTFEVMVVPEQFPDGPVDLVVLSDVAGYFSAADLAATTIAVAGALSSGGLCLVVTWAGEADDFHSTTSEVHDAFSAQPGLSIVTHKVETKYDNTYELDLFVRS